MRDGIFFLNTASLETVKRFLSGLYGHYRTFHLSDFQIYFYNDSVMVLVLPLVSSFIEIGYR